MNNLMLNNIDNVVAIRSDKVEYFGYTEGSVKDIIEVHFKLCHANTNANRDRFTVDELKSAYKTAEGKALCYGHNKTYAIGFISKSIFVDTNNNTVMASDGSTIDNDLSTYGVYEGEDPYIYCEGIIWKSRFPIETNEIIDDYEHGNLYFSMEAYFEKCQCSVCNTIAVSQNDYCDHLKNRFINNTDRILLGCTFTGSAKVDNPADIDAIGLAAANQSFSILDLLGDKLDNDIMHILLDMEMEV